MITASITFLNLSIKQSKVAVICLLIARTGEIEDLIDEETKSTGIGREQNSAIRVRKVQL